MLARQIFLGEQATLKSAPGIAGSKPAFGKWSKQIFNPLQGLTDTPFTGFATAIPRQE